jgi:hypothetical protein
MKAKALIDMDILAYLTEAGKQLVTASGILDLIETNLRSNKWTRASYSNSVSFPNPAETSPAVCAGLSLYYRSFAQILAIIKSMSNPAGSPASVKCRLSVAVINLSGASLQILEASNISGKTKFADWLNMELLHRLAANREVFTAVSFYFQGKVLQEQKQEIGAAIAYCQFAKGHLIENTSSSKYNFNGAGLPRFVGSFAHLAGSVNYLRQLLDESIAENDRTNRFVTFQVIPRAMEDLPALPAEAVIMNSTPFTAPVVEESQRVPFIAPEKKSFFGSLFSFGGSGGKTAATSNTPAATAATTEGEKKEEMLPSPAPAPLSAMGGQEPSQAPPQMSYNYNQPPTSYPQPNQQQQQQQLPPPNYYQQPQPQPSSSSSSYPSNPGFSANPNPNPNPTNYYSSPIAPPPPFPPQQPPQQQLYQPQVQPQPQSHPSSFSGQIVYPSNDNLYPSLNSNNSNYSSASAPLAPQNNYNNNTNYYQPQPLQQSQQPVDMNNNNNYPPPPQPAPSPSANNNSSSYLSNPNPSAVPPSSTHRNPPAAGARPLSDEEYARQLQEQFDRETAAAGRK